MARTSLFPTGLPTDVNDARIFREQLCQWIEIAIAILDAMDGDTDHEDDGAGEPSLGWTKTMAVGNSLDFGGHT